MFNFLKTKSYLTFFWIDILPSMICAFHRKFLAQRQIHEWNALSKSLMPLMLQPINLHHHSISTQNRHQERHQEFLYQGYHVQLWDVGRQKDAEKSDVKMYSWIKMKTYKPNFWSLEGNLLSKLSLKEFEIIIASILQIEKHFSKALNRWVSFDII